MSLTRPILTTFALLLAVAAEAQTPLQRMIAGAKAQVGKTLHYDGSYQRIAYPGGDVPIERGVCTDVVIRAFAAPASTCRCSSTRT